MKKLILSLAILLTAMGVRAEETPADMNSSTVKAKEAGVTTSEQKKDIDEEITNARLRASTGAKKNISISNSINYSGAAIINPLSTERPQLNDGAAAADPVRLNDSISIKYRLTDHDNLSLGFGVDFTPSYVADKTTGAKEPARTNASTPYLEYSRVEKSGIFQNVLSASICKYTSKEDVQDFHLNSELALSYTFMAPISASKFEAGMATAFSQEIYSQFNVGEDPGRATLYQLQLAPMLEYAFNDKFSFRTVYRWMTYTVKAGDREHAKLADRTQSVGMGYSLTRDIYLYPNMQWKWTAVSADRTTVGFSAYINL